MTRASQVRLMIRHLILTVLGCRCCCQPSVQVRDWRKFAHRHGFGLEPSRLEFRVLRTVELLSRPLGPSHCS